MQSSSFKPTIWDNTGSVVILSSKQRCNTCHWIRKTTEHEAEVEITFSFVCSPVWPVDVCTGNSVRCAHSVLFLTRLPLKNSRSEKFAQVIKVMGRHLGWQHWSPRGGGGGQVEMRNEMGLMNFCQLQGYWDWPNALTALSKMKRIIFLFKDINDT